MFNLKRTNYRPWDFQKDISGCGLSGLINKDGERVSGEVIINSIKTQHDRGNGLGGGFAAYGIYPDFKDHYAVHVMCETKDALNEFECFLKDVTMIDQQERIPTRTGTPITNAPLLMRYFVKPNTEVDNPLFDKGMSDDDFMVRMVMKVNLDIKGAFVFSSGKNMGAFKGVGYPEDVADFFRLDEYNGYIWTAHNRFPTKHAGLVGRRPSLHGPRLVDCPQRRDLVLRDQQALPGDVRLSLHAAHRHRSRGLSPRPADPQARPAHRCGMPRPGPSFLG